ncbi:MAG: hypothetical protein IPL83_05300 [Bdellovibrionales bacterium]|nr:hypothetical protein [Bdellovibrionales bacterium]
MRRRDSIKRRLAIFIYAMIGFAFASIFWFVQEISFPLISDSSVLTFARDQTRSNVYDTKHGVDWGKLKAKEHAWGKEAVESMPLYLSYKESLFANQKHQIIFGNRRGKIQSFNLNRSSVSWEAGFPEGFQLFSTPVVSKNTGIIYALGRSEDFYSAENGVPPKSGIILMALDVFTGRIVSQRQVNLAEIFSHYTPNVKWDLDPRFGLVCKTALGLREQNQGSVVYFGCSMTKNNNSHPPSERRPYRQYRGIRGVLLGLETTKNGEFAEKMPLAFFPSEYHQDNALTGFDSGIYCAGGAPPVLPDGRILVTTGNGPLIPKMNNFGCSIVKISSETFRPAVNKPGEIPFISLDVNDFEECYTSNADYSSGTVAALAVGPNKFVGFLRDKVGSVIAFDPDKMSGNHLSGREELDVRRDLEIEGLHYGQGSVFLDENSKSNLVIHHHRIWQTRRRLLATSGAEEVLSRLGYTRGHCVGYVRDKPDGRAFSLYESGPTNGAIVLVNESLENQERMTSSDVSVVGSAKEEFYWGVGGLKLPYRKLLELGFSPTKGSNYSKSKFDLVPMRLMANVDIRTSIVSMIESHYKKEPEYHGTWKVFSEDNGFILRPKKREELNSCLEHDGLVPFYEYERHESKFLGFKVSRLVYGEDLGQPRYQWVYSDDKQRFLHSSSLNTIRIAGSQDGYVLVAAHEPYKEQESWLIVLSLKDGHRISEFRFSGSHHFSQPLFTGHGVFLSTRDRGLIAVTQDELEL